MSVTTSLIPQRFARKPSTGHMTWLACEPHQAQRWLAVIRRGGVKKSKAFATKTQATRFLNMVSKALANPAVKQILSQRYDTTAYRGAIYSSKAVPTGKVKS